MGLITGIFLEIPLVKDKTPLEPIYIFEEVKPKKRMPTPIEETV